MSRLAETTEKDAIIAIQKMLPCFGQLDSLGMSAEDAFDARAAEKPITGDCGEQPPF
jgi:hypothetical protein